MNMPSIGILNFTLSAPDSITQRRLNGYHEVKASFPIFVENSARFEDFLQRESGKDFS